MLSAVILAAALTATAPVELYRQWKPNTTLTYQVKSHLSAESRHYMTSIFIPEDLDQNYTFTLQVGAVTGEGFATATYKRPKMEVIFGETAERGSLTKIEELNEHLVLTVSPVNAITDVKDLTPKKKEGDGGGLKLFRTMGDGTMAKESQDILQRFVGDLYRLALFIGNAETSVDFGPRLPLLEVEPGDTWNVTASYHPQKLSGKDGKMATQRLDYTYKYDGQVEVDGKKLERITATLAFDNDIAPFINDAIGMKPSESGLRGLKMKLDAKMEFDLDPVTKNTLAIRADSMGAFSLEITDIPDRPVQENRLRGRTRLKLLSIK